MYYFLVTLVLPRVSYSNLSRRLGYLAGPVVITLIVDRLRLSQCTLQAKVQVRRV